MQLGYAAPVQGFPADPHWNTALLCLHVGDEASLCCSSSSLHTVAYTSQHMSRVGLTSNHSWMQAGGAKCRVAIPKSAAASLEALANFALDGDEASAAALAPEDMDLVRGDDGG